MNKPPYILSFDAESAGLHGPVFAIGYVVADSSGDIIEYDYKSTGIDSIWNNMGDDDRKWIVGNIPSHVLFPPSTNEIRYSVIDGMSISALANLETWFIKVIRDWIKKEALILVDCGYPVETNFLGKLKIPVYPLIDLGSILHAKEIDPKKTFERKEDEKPAHDPLCDARQSLRIYREQMGH